MITSPWSYFNVLLLAKTIFKFGLIHSTKNLESWFLTNLLIEKFGIKFSCIHSQELFHLKIFNYLQNPLKSSHFLFVVSEIGISCTPKQTNIFSTPSVRIDPRSAKQTGLYTFEGACGETAHRLRTTRIPENKRPLCRGGKPWDVEYEYRWQCMPNWRWIGIQKEK